MKVDALDHVEARFTDLWMEDRVRLLVELAHRPEREAVAAWARLVVAHVPTGRLDRLAAEGIVAAPRHAEVVVPALTELLDEEAQWPSLVHALRAYAHAGKLTIAPMLASAPRLLGMLSTLEARARGRAGIGGARWRWAPEYARDRATAGELLDLLGHLPMGVVGVALTEALQSPDPLWRLHAAIALWRAGGEVPESALRPLFADAETRAWTYECCVAAERLSHVPATARDAVSLATSAVAAFATQPHLLGTLPDAVELCEVTRATADEVGWWYLFRFRAPTDHPQHADGWLAALAGPLPAPEDERGAVPAFVATRLEPLDAHPVGDHFARLVAAREQFPVAPACR